MTNWRERLEKVLRGGMKYCFPQVQTNGQTTFPTLSEEEFMNAESGGFFHFIASVVLDARKKSFQDGFRAGADTARNGVRPREWKEVDGHPVEVQPYTDELFSLACGRAWEANEAGTSTTHVESRA